MHGKMDILKNTLALLVFILSLFCLPCFLFAEDNSSISKKTSTQQVGGLLFDMDDGVKIEKGPGGSVYVKSNKEYIQQKFLDMESRLTQLEGRITELENKLKSPGEVEKKSSSEKPSQETSGRQVLIS